MTDLVTIDGISLFIHQQAAVRIAVERDAQIVLPRHDAFGKRFQMGRATVRVDVDTVRLGMDKVSLERQHAKKLRCRRGCSAVGAIHQNPQAGQITIQSGVQVMDVILLHLAHAMETGTDLAVGLGGNVGVIEDQLLHLSLHFVGQLVALAVENLDTVVLKGIVRRGDDDTGISVLLHRQKRNGRRRNGSERHHVTAHGADARHQGGLQHIRGDACVLADGNDRLVTQTLRQDRCHSAANLIGQLSRQRLTYDAPNTVCSK